MIGVVAADRFMNVFLSLDLIFDLFLLQLKLLLLEQEELRSFVKVLIAVIVSSCGGRRDRGHGGRKRVGNVGWWRVSRLQCSHSFTRMYQHIGHL